MQLPTSAVAALILTTLGIAILISFFLLGIQLSPVEATRTFTEGCLTYCREIESEAVSTGEQLAIIAVRKAEQLKTSPFIQACERLYPDTAGFAWQCWNRPGCCTFQLPQGG